MGDRWNAFFADAPEEGAQWGLLCLMTGISEGYWCASWLTGLELALWDAAYGGERTDGMSMVTDRQAALLRLLSEEAGGWWVWDGEIGPRFLSLEEWRALRDTGGDSKTT